MASASEIADPVPDRLRGAGGAAYLALLAGSVTMLAYLVVLVGYLLTTGTEVLDPGRAMYPALWFSLSAGALAATFGMPTLENRHDRRTQEDASDEVIDRDEPCAVDATRNARWPIALGIGYVLLLAGVSGALSVGIVGAGVTVSSGLPGWAPILVANLGIVSVVLVPFQVAGYVVLGALLTRAVAVTTGSILAGVAGLFTCAGCVLPIVAAIASAGSIPLLAGGLSYGVSTIAFALTATVFTAIVVRERTTQETCIH